MTFSIFICYQVDVLSITHACDHITMNVQSNILALFPWITSNFVQSVIEKSEPGKNVILKSFTAKKCCDAGENFSSYMIAVNALFTDGLTESEEQSDFLLKIALPTEDYGKICEECLIYEKEIEAYTKILPAIKSAFESIGVSADIAPR